VVRCWYCTVFFYTLTGWSFNRAMQRIIWISIGIGLCLLLSFFADGTFAQEAKYNPEPSKFKLGFTERFRLVSWDNAISLDDTLDDGYMFTRHLTSVSAQWRPKTELEFFLKISNEFRIYSKPKDREFNFSELFLDNLYFRWNKPGGLPLSLKLGRQNIMLGEGFIVMDGHPLDGSRSIYFNAVRMDISLNPNNMLTLFYTYQPVIDDFPVLNGQDQMLVEQPEQGLGAYFSWHSEVKGFDAYLIRKNVLTTTERPTKSNINALGMRFVLPFLQVLSLAGEGTYQFGSFGEYGRSAWGGHFHLDYNAGFQRRSLPKFSLGSIYLSGDDTATDKMEGWDPLFSRWPKWSESYIYTLIKEQEGRVAYWSNFIAVYESMQLRISPRINLSLTHFNLSSVHIPTAGLPYPGGNGKDRGSLWIFKVYLRLHRSLTGHLLYEAFSPGSFYFPGAARYSWLRFELKYSL